MSGMFMLPITKMTLSPFIANVKFACHSVKADNRKCVQVTVVPKSFKFTLLPTDSVFLDHVVLWRTINLGRHISDISKKSMQATIYCHYD
jgi:hypothetical protein